MDNIFSYLMWRGDLDFKDTKFNDVDNLVLCAFTYLNLDKYISFNDIISIENLAKKIEKDKQDKNIFNENKLKLIKILSISKRFKNVYVSKYLNIVDKEKEEQFRAMTFILPNDNLYIAFSGTDEYLSSWKEDFNYAFMEVIPSQKEALNYLEEILSKTTKDVYVGGHSKGGNLAFFASIYLDNKLKPQIIKVYNNDGPGLQKKCFNSIGFKIIKNKMVSFIPKESIIGNIFANLSRTYIVESSYIGLSSHNLYSWHVKGDKIVCLDEKDQKSVLKINELINKISISKREEIINFIYDILKEFKIDNIEDFLTSNLKLHSLTSKEMDVIKEIINLVFKYLKN